MPNEQQQTAQDGEIGKAAAAELSGKISNDEQKKLDRESDENYDAQFQQHLEQKLKPEIEAFNEQAEFADSLKLRTSSGMLQFFRDDAPAYALLIRNRELHFLEPGSSVPVSSLHIVGGPEEYVFHGGSGAAAPIDEADALKGLLRLAAGGSFQGA